MAKAVLDTPTVRQISDIVVGEIRLDFRNLAAIVFIDYIYEDSGAIAKTEPKFIQTTTGARPDEVPTVDGIKAFWQALNTPAQGEPADPLEKFYFRVLTEMVNRGMLDGVTIEP